MNARIFTTARAGCAAAIVLAAATVLFSQTQTALPPAAQEAIDKGVLAAKLPDYPLAIRYFEEARKIAPDSPAIYFNLGLAESKIPGRELRAICWFSAYLAADPKSVNAASVKEQIQILEIKSQSNVSHLIQNLQESPANDKNNGFAMVAELWADSGDVATALKVSRLIQSDVYRGTAQVSIAASQAKAGDFQGALKTAELVERPDYRSRAFLKTAEIQIDNGDLTGAESSIAQSRRAADSVIDDKSSQLKEVAEMQIKAGNKTAAQATLKAALVAEDSRKISDYMDLVLKTQVQSYIANVQISAGDIEGAKQTLFTTFKETEQISDPAYRAQRQEDVLEYQAQAGDASNAMKTYKALLKSISLISDAARQKSFTDHLRFEQGGLAEAQAKAGDFAGALKMANEITDRDKRSWTLYHIAQTQAAARDFDGATKTTELIQNADYRLYAVSTIASERAKPNTPPVPATKPTPPLVTAKPTPLPLTAKEWTEKLSYLEANYFLDLPGYLKTLPAADPNQMLTELYRSVSTMVARQKDVVAALKRKAIN